MRRADRVGGTATILVTDLVGSTAMFDRLGDETAERVLRAHLGEMRDLVGAFGGREVKSTGDGIMAAFPAAWLASECAVAMQRTLHLAREGAEVPLHIRIGLHSGDTTADRHDYYGIAVAVAARLCDRAPADGILMSGVTRGLVGSRGGHSFADAGVSELKGIDEPVRAWTVEWGPGQLPPAAPPELEPKRGRLLGAAAAALLIVGVGTGMLLADEEDAAPVPTPVPAGGDLVRISLKYTGTETAGRSYSPDISGDGSAAIFVSDARNIVEGDHNGVSDVFHVMLPPGRREAAERAVTLVSIAGGGQTSGRSTLPSVSDDGGAVAFLGETTDSPARSGRQRSVHVFVRALPDGETERASISTDGEIANGPSYDNDISGDGALVAFTTAATNLAFENRDTNEANDVFVHDRRAPKTNRVNIRSGTLDEANGHSFQPVLSEDGRYVAFVSKASDLVPGDTNNRLDVFRYDRAERKTIRISLTSAGEPTNDPSDEPSISDDGNRVVFASTASNLVGERGDIARSIFVRDVEAGTTTLVSRSYADAEPGNGASSSPEISGDGRYVVFASKASDLVPGDENGVADIFVFDLETGTTVRVSTGIDGDTDADSFDPAITDDGSYVVFASNASNLVADDINNVTDVFLRGPLTE
ncbi:MAG TPA: adenylate/guanylate cyclase domain-containing protein [Actinomycetota bacterium]|nr:adenylate/guanylate cyclase domain-containing protein [Actinomycetota bacterium]